MSGNPPSRNESQSTAKARRGPGVTSLSPLLRHLIGLSIIVELKNGKSYKGTLFSSDASMNLVLRLVQLQKYDTTHQDTILETTSDRMNNLMPIDFELMHIRGSMIRYIHFPYDADIPTLIRAGLDRERAAVDRYKRGKRK